MSWLKRNAVLIINLCVLSLFLWLCMRFMVLALNQRDQAKLLQSSIDTQTSIYELAQAFTFDQENAFRFYLSTEKKSEPKPTDLNPKRSALDLALEAQSNAVHSSLIPSKFNQRIRSSQQSIQELNGNLIAHISGLSDNTRNRLSGLASAETLFQEIGNVDSDISAGMAHLSGSLSYLPDLNAAEVSVLQSMLVSATKLRMDLSHLKLEFWKYAGSAEEGQQTLSPHLLKINDSILLQIETLSLLSHSSLVSSPELTTARTLQNQYLAAVSNDGTLFAEPVDQGSDAPSSGTNTSLNGVVSQLDLIGTTAMVELRDIANSQLTRANKTLLIDMLLVAMCFLIGATLFMLTRRTTHLVYVDQLTGLKNRAKLEMSLLNLSSTHSTEMHALIFIDLDRFKAINDNYGHEIGDELIKVVATRLEQLIGLNADVFRHGGDEFAVLVKNIESETQIMALADQLLKSIRDDIVVRNHVLRVGASAGVSVCPDDGNTGMELLRNADLAMYQCKTSKQDDACRFDSGAAKNYQSRLDIEIALRNALQKNEFQLFFQPKVCTKTGSVKSVEALLRWVHTEWGVVSPGEFIPVAEDLALMGEIGNWVINEACRQITEFKRLTHLNIAVAVNVSSQQFGDQRFDEHVFSALQANEMDAHGLELEVTESVLMDETARVISLLGKLRDRGIKIALDDFGTGYSSLQYLQKLPLDVLKIDRAFVLATDGADPKNSVANLIVQLAKLFNLETVAEGVETQEQDEKLRSLGVDHIQGYRYSKPVPVEDLADAIRTVHSRFGSGSSDARSRAA